MHRPILIVVIGYIIGIIWGLYFKISIVFFYLFLIILYIIIKFPYSKKKFRIFSIKRYFRYIALIFKINNILIIIISSFISNIIITYQENKYNNLFKEGQQLDISAIVVSNIQEKDFYNRFKIKWQNEYLYINVNKSIQLEYGDKVHIQGKFQEPQTARNYKGFNYKQYLKTLKIHGTIKVADIEIIDKNCANKLLQASNSMFLKIKSNVEQNYSKDISGVMLGIMLGYTEQIDERIKEDFSTSNISHVLAVSGMHISYAILLLTSSSKKILGKKYSKIFASIILFIYMFITGFSVSVIRASIMGILSCMSFVFYRKSNTLNNMAIAILITLINNPYNITSMSFLLTYGGTIGIIYFNLVIEKIIKSIKIRNRKWKYIYLKIQIKCEKIIQLTAVSISAQIIIAPIIIVNFNTFGIGFLLTNLFLNCVIGAIVMGGFIQITISFISIKVGNALAQIIEIPIYLLLWISKIDIGNFNIVTPDLYKIVGYFLSVCLFSYLYMIFNAKHCTVTQNRIKNTIHLIKYKIKPYLKIICFILSILFLIVIIVNKSPHDLKIFFIDVGQGDSTLIRTPYNKNILIDGGGSESYDVGENILVPYLLNRKVSKLDYVIISHFDQDHIGGILAVLEKLEVNIVIISEQGENNDNYNKFKKIIDQKNIKVMVVKQGDRLNIEKNFYFDILWPKDSKLTDDLNNNSIVCKLQYENFSMLFTGDIEEGTEKEILKEYKDNLQILSSIILKVGHHGSKTSSTQEFIEMVKPKIGLIGVGNNNKFGHPNNQVLERLRNLRNQNLSNR